MGWLRICCDRPKREAGVRLRARSRTPAWIPLCRRAAVVAALEAAEALRAGAVGKVATFAQYLPDHGKCYGNSVHRPLRLGKRIRHYKRYDATVTGKWGARMF